jgi:hypothetical protein
MVKIYVQFLCKNNIQDISTIWFQICRNESSHKCEPSFNMILYVQHHNSNSTHITSRLLKSTRTVIDYTREGEGAYITSRGYISTNKGKWVPLRV